MLNHNGSAILNNILILFSIFNSYVLQEENDVNYEEEAEVADEFDSDFDEDVGIS